MSSKKSKQASRSALAEEIRAIREAMGLTQAEFAGVLEVDQSTLQNWENDRNEPHKKMFARIRALRPTARRYSAETREQLVAALDLILDRAPSEVVKKVEEILTKYAGRFAEER